MNRDDVFFVSALKSIAKKIKFLVEIICVFHDLFVCIFIICCYRLLMALNSLL